MASRKKTTRRNGTPPQGGDTARAEGQAVEGSARRNGSLGVNKVILVGNLGHDPELRYTSAGTPVANLRIATSAGFRDAEGNLERRTEWHRVVVWNRLAEVAAEHLARGRQVYVEGRLQTREWTPAGGGDRRFTTEVVAQQLRILGGRPGAAAPAGEPLPDGGDIPF